ncbi:TIGR00282 family metallophosphoesterase [Elusimicrobiota bacterium]
MNILFLGDIVGKPGRDAVKNHLETLKKQNDIAFTIVNGENSAGGLGITPEIYRELLGYGIDVITTGNHIWKRKEIYEIIDQPQLLRPANYPDEAPGRGYGKYRIDNTEIAVINLQGRIFIEPINCPFTVVDSILKELKGIKIIIVDVHAEATSEKMALGWYLDGKVSAVLGTHTHVMTSDARIMPEGTGYITDAGMTGSKSGIIGVEKEEIIRKFITGMPFRFKVSKGKESIEGVVLEVDEKSGKCIRLKSISVPVKV